MRQAPNNPEDDGWTQSQRGKVEFLKIMFFNFHTHEEMKAMQERLEEEKARKDWQDQGGF